MGVIFIPLATMICHPFIILLFLNLRGLLTFYDRTFLHAWICCCFVSSVILLSLIVDMLFPVVCVLLYILLPITLKRCRRLLTVESGSDRCILTPLLHHVSSAVVSLFTPQR